MSEPREPHRVVWAIEQVRLGRKVRRASWGTGAYIYATSPDENDVYAVGPLSIDLGDDWELYNG